MECYQHAEFLNVKLGGRL